MTKSLLVGISAIVIGSISMSAVAVPQSVYTGPQWAYEMTDNERESQLAHAYIEGNPTTVVQKQIASLTGGKEVTGTIYNTDGTVNIKRTAQMLVKTNGKDPEVEAAKRKVERFALAVELAYAHYTALENEFSQAQSDYSDASDLAYDIYTRAMENPTTNDVQQWRDEDYLPRLVGQSQEQYDNYIRDALRVQINEEDFARYLEDSSAYSVVIRRLAKGLDDAMYTIRSLVGDAE